ncbi:MAG: SMC family ATPase [archaeon]
MILKRLELHNIRSYQDATLEFPKGSILLSGDIGAGKSSILLAIEFALFGTRRSQLSANSLLRNGEKSGDVMLTLEVGGKEVSVKRTLKRAKDTIKQETGFVIVDGVKREGTPIELKSMMLELLGYPQELVRQSSDLIFRYTVYTPQEGMKAILMDEPEARIDTLRKVFLIDRYKRIRDSSKTMGLQLRQRIRELRAKAEDLRERQGERKTVDAQVNEAKEKADNLEPLIKEMKEKLKTANDRRESLRKDAEGMRAKQEEIGRVRDRSAEKKKEQMEVLADMEKAIANKKKVQEELANIPTAAHGADITALRNEQDSLRKMLADHDQKKALVEQQIESITVQIKTLEEETAKLDGVRTRIKTATVEIADAQKVLSEKETLSVGLTHCREELASWQAKAGEATHIMKDVGRIIEQIDTLASCPTCLQPVGVEHKTKVKQDQEFRQEAAKKKANAAEHGENDSRRKIEAAEKKLQEIEETAKNVAAKKASLEALRKEEITIMEKTKLLTGLKEKSLTLAVEKVDNKSKDHTKEKARLEELIKAIETASKQEELVKRKILLEKQLEESDVRITALDKKGEMLSAAIKDLVAEADELTEQTKDLLPLEKNIAEAQKTLDDIRLREKELSEQRAAASSRATSLLESLVRLDKEIADKKKFIATAAEQTKIEDWLSSFFSPLMETMERQVMLSVHREFEQLFVQWFNILIEDENLNVRLDEEFSPVIEQNGHETVVGNLSGGEKTALALAYRLALNQAINDFVSGIRTKDMIILDEPTDGFSSHQLDRIRDVLEQLKVKQIIIVSHESKIESFVDNVLRVEKTEHASAVQPV